MCCCLPTRPPSCARSCSGPPSWWVTSSPPLGVTPTSSNASVAALRHARRRGRDILAQVKEASQVVHDQFGGDQFVTAAVASVDVPNSQMRIVNAGHPQPWLARGDSVRELDLYADFPLGLFPGGEYREQMLALEPGDRVVLVSDGVTEASSPEGEEFGDD